MMFDSAKFLLAERHGRLAGTRPDDALRRGAVEPLFDFELLPHAASSAPASRIATDGQYRP